MRTSPATKTTRIRTTSSESAALWDAYRRNPGVSTRNALAVAYLYIVKTMAWTVHRRTPHGVLLEDLESHGFLGLLDAIRRFDPKRGVKFETFCQGRVRGAILDGLRNEDVAPRLSRSRANAIEKAYLEMERRLGRPPTDPEVARHMGLSLKSFDRRRMEVGPLFSAGVPIPRRILDADPLVPVDIAFREDKRTEGTFKRALRRDYVRTCLRSLALKGRFVVHMYYLHDLSLHEIGLAMDLSESRVCQIHARALRHIRSREKRWVA